MMPNLFSVDSMNMAKDFVTNLVLCVLTEESVEISDGNAPSLYHI